MFLPCNVELLSLRPGPTTYVKPQFNYCNSATEMRDGMLVEVIRDMADEIPTFTNNLKPQYAVTIKGNRMTTF